MGLIARGEAGLRSAQAEIAGAGGTACMTVADVRDAAALERAADSIERALGTIDVWINCAGNGVYGRFVDVPPEEFDCVTDVTYRGTVNGTRAALRRMLPRNAGTVVNVCSAIAYHGMPLLTSYSGAKAAVRGFTDGVRAELAHDASRVHVTIVFPACGEHAVLQPRGDAHGQAAAARQAGLSAGDRCRRHPSCRHGAATGGEGGGHHHTVRAGQ